MWLVEAVALILVVGGLVLIGLRIISWENGLSLITMGIGLIGGKYAGSLERRVLRRLGTVALSRKFKEIGLIIAGPEAVHIEVPTEIFSEELAEKISRFAAEVFPGRRIEVVKGERIRLV
ncbi:MAG: hypothetical protein QXE50_06005 [Nitrososphaerota archaeon]